MFSRVPTCDHLFGRVMGLDRGHWLAVTACYGNYLGIYTVDYALLSLTIYHQEARMSEGSADIP